MDFSVLERATRAADAIYVPASDANPNAAGDRSEQRKAKRRRDFAMLIRSIRMLVREDV